MTQRLCPEFPKFRADINVVPEFRADINVVPEFRADNNVALLPGENLRGQHVEAWNDIKGQYFTFFYFFLEFSLDFFLFSSCT